MKPALLALGLFCAGQATAQAQTGGTQVFACNHSPVGCYVTTHSDRVTKSVHFYNDGYRSCGVRITNCNNGKCGSFTRKLQRGTYYNGQNYWFASKSYSSVNQQYTFTFSGRHLGGGVREHMKFHIKNYDPDTHKKRGTITSYFRASPGGC
ncbi:hypothetical protein [Roseovarius salinarum]|uniref:hypothetical protein n=1 Tax=Roseovarius salinarum TaxID=1981892 RepID=UPI000C3368E4|nr:hypothetical protein [Roseovarius salinarum]